ncbi:MAG TPA: hypothetical protein VIY54_07310 [Steroidobacteraceae bacterium]
MDHTLPDIAITFGPAPGLNPAEKLPIRSIVFQPQGDYPDLSAPQNKDEPSSPFGHPCPRLSE